MFQPAEVLEFCKHKLHVIYAHLIILLYVKLSCSIQHARTNSTLHATGCNSPYYVNVTDVLTDKRMPYLCCKITYRVCLKEPASYDFI
jgi:orotate phosphoribosyltransferase